jgi:peptidoglycan/LPS O-acetylase OafA/YrhL
MIRRIPSLDGLRAISISMVIAGHLAGEGYAPDFLRFYAIVGVKIFFVLSGYLITGILLREQDRTSTINLRHFYIRRVYRIVPAALFYMLVTFAVNWRTLRWYEMAMALLYVVNYFPRPYPIGHLWSLSVEEQFYILWPSVLKRWHPHRTGILLGLLVFSPVYNAALYYLNLTRKFGLVGLPSLADGLAVGCLAAVFAARWPRIPKGLFATAILLMAAIPRFDASSTSRTLLELFVMNPLLNAAIACILIHVVQNPYRILNLAPVMWLGQISYSLYLWQQPFVNPASPMRYGVLAALAMACCSYYLIERPLLRYRDRRELAPSGMRIQKAA